MRVAVVVTLVFLSACAGEKLALAPPSGVDLSGRWRLNEADSDDPLRLTQSQTAAPSPGSAGSGGQGGQGGRGGRQGGGRGRGGFGGGGGGGGPGGPSMPGMDALGEGLRWPGKEVEIKQIAGAVAMTSAGVNRVYQPVSVDMKRRHRKRPDNDEAVRGRDMPARTQGESPAICGWEDKTLVIQSGGSDDDRPPFEERYSLSGDGRLIEIIGFRGGRSGGFTMSRVWDRVMPGTAPPESGAGPPASPSGSSGFKPIAQ